MSLVLWPIWRYQCVWLRNGPIQRNDQLAGCSSFIILRFNCEMVVLPDICFMCTVVMITRVDNRLYSPS